MMYEYKHPHPSVTTDCVIFGFDGIDLKVLLIERGVEPYKGQWAFPGGFLRMDETAEEGAARELKENAQWFSIKSIPTLAFDHETILRKAYSNLKEKLHFEPIGFELLPEQFSMTELQNLYEAILEVKFDRRNFYKKIIKLDLLSPVNPAQERKSNRVPILYKFNPEKYQELNERDLD